MEALIVGSFLFIFYTYFGFPLLLRALRRRAAPETDRNFAPPVSVVIAAFNEEESLRETLASILACDYPPSSLEIIVVSDASADRTDEIAASFAPERVRLLRQGVRSGQTRGMLRGSQAARGEIVLMADASGHFLPDTLRRIVRHFVDPRVGAVSGYMVIPETGTAVSKGNNLYARYDMTLRRLESETGSSWVGCEGGLFAIRKGLFKADFPLDIAADNATCYELYEQGYQHRFDPEAAIYERSSRDLANEFRRKIRIIVLQLRGFWAFRRLFVPWKHPMFFFQNVSHKLFRWLVPFALIAMWAASGASAAPWARLFFSAQCAFYAAALIGAVGRRKRRMPWLLSIPAYFVTVNLASLLAWAFLFHDYTVWTPPTRDRQMADAESRNG